MHRERERENKTTHSDTVTHKVCNNSASGLAEVIAGRLKGFPLAGLIIPTEKVVLLVVKSGKGGGEGRADSYQLFSQRWHCKKKFYRLTSAVFIQLNTTVEFIVSSLLRVLIYVAMTALFGHGSLLKTDDSALLSDFSETQRFEAAVRERVFQTVLT